MSGNYDQQKSVTRSEILNPSARMSAFHDFMKRTMTLLNGVWSKLNYIRELRTSAGTYEHWGLSKTHGERAANNAIADIHSELYLQLLSTPLHELHEQLSLSAEDAGCSPRDLVEQLFQQQQRITPNDLRGGAPEHLKSVLVVNRLLAARPKPMTRDVSPQPRVQTTIGDS